MFTTEEANSLLLGSKLIEKFSDISVNRYFAGAMDKIKLVLEKKSEHLNTLSSYIEVLKTAPGSRNGFPNDFLTEIQAVLGRNRVIRIEYTSGYKEETTRRMIEPLQKYYFGFVQQKELDGRIEMHFLTASYEGIARWLLSFVDAVKVISPEPLKGLLRCHALRLFAHYYGP